MSRRIPSGCCGSDDLGPAEHYALVAAAAVWSPAPIAAVAYVKAGDLFARVRMGGTWGVETALESLAAPVDAPLVAVTPQGLVVAGWRHVEAAASLWRAERPPGGSWSPAVAVAAIGATEHLRLVVDPGGSGLMGWTHSGSGPMGRIARRSGLEDKWEGPADLGPAAATELFDLALSSRGNGAAAWGSVGSGGVIWFR